MTSTDPLIRPLSTLTTQELQEEGTDMVSRLEKEYFTEAYAAWWAQDDEAAGDNSFDGPNRMLEDRFAAIEAADIASLRELTEQKEQADKRLNLLRNEPVSGVLYLWDRAWYASRGILIRGGLFRRISIEPAHRGKEQGGQPSQAQTGSIEVPRDLSRKGEETSAGYRAGSGSFGQCR